jgi:hypothetical protein
MHVMVMTVMPTHRLRQILDVGEVAALRRIRKIRGKLAELGRRGGIALRLRILRGALQIRGDLLGNLLVFGRVRLLKLLQFAHHLGERRKPAVIWLRDR